MSKTFYFLSLLVCISIQSSMEYLYSPTNPIQIYEITVSDKDLECLDEALEMTLSRETNAVIFHKMVPQPVIIHRSILIAIDLLRQVSFSDAKALYIKLTGNGDNNEYLLPISVTKLKQLCNTQENIIGERYVIDKFIRCSNRKYDGALLKARVDYQPDPSIPIYNCPFVVTDHNNKVYRAYSLHNDYANYIVSSIAQKKAFKIYLRDVNYPDMPTIPILCFPEWLPKRNPKWRKTIIRLIAIAAFSGLIYFFHKLSNCKSNI